MFRFFTGGPTELKIIISTNKMIFVAKENRLELESKLSLMKDNGSSTTIEIGKFSDLENTINIDIFDEKHDQDDLIQYLNAFILFGLNMVLKKAPDKLIIINGKSLQKLFNSDYQVIFKQLPILETKKNLAFE